MGLEPAARSTILLLAAQGDPAELLGAAAHLPAHFWAWRITDPALPKSDPDGKPLATVASLHCLVVDLDAGQDPDAALTALGSSVDRQASSVLTGPRHRIILGDGGAAAQACVCRLSALTPAEFAEHWLIGHAPLASDVPGASGYEQRHADLSQSRALAAALDFGGPAFDGIGRLLFPTPEVMYGARASDSVKKVATQDEMRFIDHTRSQVTALRRVGPITI